MTSDMITARDSGDATAQPAGAPVTVGAVASSAVETANQLPVSTGAGAMGIGETPGGGVVHRPLELLHGVEMAVTVELGRTRMLMRDLLNLRAGSIVELDRPAGGPVDVVVNGTLLARGEVVVLDDELGVRITEVVGATEDH